jgi:hypothetical protein
VRAGDHLLLAAAWLVVIALPWHPAVWYILGRLRLAIELDCDARVLRAGASPRSTARLLIEVATHGGGSRIGALALADGPSQLELRIRAMNEPRKRHRAASVVRRVRDRRSRLVLVACEAKNPDGGGDQADDVASASEARRKEASCRTAAREYTDFFIRRCVGMSEEQLPHSMRGRSEASTS